MRETYFQATSHTLMALDGTFAWQAVKQNALRPSTATSVIGVHSSISVFLLHRRECVLCADLTSK